MPRKEGIKTWVEGSQDAMSETNETIKTWLFCKVTKCGSATQFPLSTTICIYWTPQMKRDLNWLGIAGSMCDQSDTDLYTIPGHKEEIY